MSSLVDTLSYSDCLRCDYIFYYKEGSYHLFGLTPTPFATKLRDKSQGIIGLNGRLHTSSIIPFFGGSFLGQT